MKCVAGAGEFGTGAKKIAKGAEKEGLAFPWEEGPERGEHRQGTMIVGTQHSPRSARQD